MLNKILDVTSHIRNQRKQMTYDDIIIINLVIISSKQASYINGNRIDRIQNYSFQFHLLPFSSENNLLLDYACRQKKNLCDKHRITDLYTHFRSNLFKISFEEFIYKQKYLVKYFRNIIHSVQSVHNETKNRIFSFVHFLMLATNFPLKILLNKTLTGSTE